MCHGQAPLIVVVVVVVVSSYLHIQHAPTTMTTERTGIGVRRLLPIGRGFPALARAPRLEKLERRKRNNQANDALI